jgi:hypothetical protein
MKELLKTTDAVYLSFVQAVLEDAGIACVVLDGHMSILEGSLGVLPRRVMVADGELEEARHCLAEASKANP